MILKILEFLDHFYYVYPSIEIHVLCFYALTMQHVTNYLNFNWHIFSNIYTPD